MNKRVKIEMDGGVQVIRIPAGFHIDGEEVTLHRAGTALLIEPVPSKRRSWEEWSEDFDKYRGEVFMPEGREQPPMPPPFDVFKE